MNDQAPQPIILSETSDGITTLTLNRPPQRNALSMELMQALIDELAIVAGDESVNVVVLKGSGPGFCAGHDLRELRAAPGEAALQRIFDRSARLMMAIVDLPQAVIACVRGVATAAGCQLVATCDLAIAADSAQFATPGSSMGAFCSTPAVALSRNIGRKNAMEMLLTGEMIDAATAERYGLINRAVPEADLDATVMALARRITSMSPDALRTGKAAFYRQLECDLASAYEHSGAVMAKSVASDAAIEGIDAFLDRRQPD